MKAVARVVPGFVLVLTAMLSLPSPSSAAPPSQTDTLIRLEAHWIAAILNGDKTAVAAILSKDFKHVLNDGTLLDRAQELAGIKKEPFAIALSDETVDFDSSGDSAVMHGVDTVTEAGKATKRQRWTDVFFKENGTWMAVSAQENVIAP
ncbi:MAG TPA: nuclear transport factor 2 family protein [Candidatus Acidoferrales bacterium]|jgi:hypothetical protein|nr:nuclear transport factor 2 family protein [Candidatus Acidoferrales bacterium]